ncbi:MAG: START-like domain-containing protein [Bacteroidota bacterium]
MSKKKKIRLEFAVKSSPAILYNSISSPSGLSTWFADDVDIYNNNYKFKWDGEEQIAELIKKTANKGMKFRWKDAKADEYFEFEIIQDELTDDVALVITDFVEETDEANATQLWDSQVHELKMSLGG